MAKEIRAITASEDIAAVIDRGAEVDKQIKTLGAEDKGIKSRIVDVLSGEIQGGEQSIRIQASQAAAVLTASESMSVDASSESYPQLQEALEEGELATVVEQKKELVVPPHEIEEAARVLKAAGILATITYSVSVKAVDVRKMRESEVASSEEAEARQALEACLSTSTTHKVKYEKL